MNLLDSVLCTANAEEYSKNFKEYGIDAFTLKVLSDEDLQILGIKEEEKRTTILQLAANLQISSEQHFKLEIDEKYILTVLAQMSVHLTKHLAALSIAANRQDVNVCDVRLFPATNCLKSCITSLAAQLTEMEEKIITKQQMKRKKYKRFIIPTTLLVAIGLISFKAYQYIPKKF